MLDVLPMAGGPGVDPDCVNEMAQFYTQVFCQHNDEEMEWRQYINWYLTVQILAVAFVYSVFIILIKWNASKKYYEWDQETTTIADYTISYKIPDVEYDYYVNDVWPYENRPDDETNVNFGFSKYLKKEFERIL